jgi:glycosyltransferase involved in cell wall biosynthesis
VLISTFGLVDFESKKVDKVIGAVARVQKRLQARGSPVKLHLAVVGETHGEHVVDIMREIADKHGYNRSALLHVTGRVDAGQYADWLERTAVAVQLRVKTNGERSAALADCLAMGIPTIVNPIGAVATDIPSDAVLPLDVSAAMERTSPAATEDVDPEALAALLERVLFDHALLRRVSERAEAFAKVHSFDHLAQQYLRLFRR